MPLADRWGTIARAPHSPLRWAKGEIPCMRRSNMIRASFRSGLQTGVALSVVGMMFAAPVRAQQTADADSKIEEIVVTGTSIRGVAPAGAQTFAIDQAAIQATNALSTDQLLATIPQLNSF